MVTIDVSAVPNGLGELLDTVSLEPVTIERAGQAVAILISPSEFERLSVRRETRKAGSMKHLFAGVDVNELLATPIDDVFADYM